MGWPRHPFPVTCTFRRCVLVNFAVDPGTLARQLPPHLEPDIVGDRAFVAVVIGLMQDMRPVGVPRAFGITYDQIVYRAVVRCGGRRGVYFLRSDADNRLMCTLGRRMSFFGFHRSRVDIETRGARLDVRVVTDDDPGADITAQFGIGDDELPPTSVFADVPTAAEHLVELFTAHNYDERRNRFESVTIDRNPWEVTALPLPAGRFEFFERGPIFGRTTARIDNVLAVSDVDYRWHRLQATARPRPPLEGPDRRPRGRTPRRGAEA